MLASYFKNQEELLERHDDSVTADMTKSGGEIAPWSFII
jgi:hypothetical protein